MLLFNYDQCLFIVEKKLMMITGNIVDNFY